MKYRVSWTVEVDVERQADIIHTAARKILEGAGKLDLVLVTDPTGPHAWASVYEDPTPRASFWMNPKVP